MQRLNLCEWCDWCWLDDDHILEVVPAYNNGRVEALQLVNLQTDECKTLAKSDCFIRIYPFDNNYVAVIKSHACELFKYLGHGILEFKHIWNTPNLFSQWNEQWNEIRRFVDSAVKHPRPRQDYSRRWRLLFQKRKVFDKNGIASFIESSEAALRIGHVSRLWSWRTHHKWPLEFRERVFAIMCAVARLENSLPFELMLDLVEMHAEMF